MESKRTDPQAYHRIQYIFFYIGLIVDLIALWLFHQNGLSFRLRDFSFQKFCLPFFAHAVYLTIFSLGIYVLHFPFSFFLGFIWEHKFGLSTQNFTQWFNDHLKKNLLGFAVLLVSVEVMYFFLIWARGQWWIWVGVFWLFLSLILARLTPQFIIPLFFKYAQVQDENLKKAIFELFRKCNVTLKNVYTVDLSSKTKKANAFMCGVGKERRVVLSDTLVNNFSVGEIETVIAHELAHYKHHDIIRLLVVNTLVVLGGLWSIDQVLRNAGVTQLQDIGHLPLLAFVLTIFSFLMMPLLNGYSRRREEKADEFCLCVTQKKDEFISMMQKLGAMNLAEPQPMAFNEFLFYDHPPIYKRIKMAQEFSCS